MSREQSDWRKELFSERSYRELVFKAWSVNRSFFSSVVFIFIFSLVSFGGIVSDINLFGGKGLGEAIVTLVRSLCSTGLSFASSMIAFIIAGFTIFATVTKPSLFISLANIQHPDYEISRLKYVFFTFMMTFWHFIVFTLICSIIVFLFPQGAPATKLIGYLLSDYPLVRGVLIYMALGTVTSYMIYLVFEIKYFVWNIYQAVLLSVAFETSQEEKRATKKV